MSVEQVAGCWWAGWPDGMECAAKAKAIVAYRESNGPFATVDELLEVKGIGKAILDKNREKLEVN
jgi:competence ComEA-like helix-hairpin-helix protein